MITTEQRYAVVGIMAVFLALTFRDMMYPAYATAASDEPDQARDPLAGEEYNYDDDERFGMPSKTVDKKIPRTNLRNIITGPTIKITYCYSCGYRKAFEEYASILRERYPEITVIGDNHPPPPLRQFGSQFLTIAKIAVIFMVLSNINPFDLMGQPTPSFWIWLSGNKLYGCLMTFFISNTIESQLISTGAFEISYNDIPIWSKIQTGRIPSPPELFQLIDNQNLNRADIYNYKY